ncbi:MAG: RDD family protein [Acidimicrobiia bacterium]
MTASTIRNPQARTLQGNRAGIVSRVIADGIDYLIVFFIYFGILIGLAVAEYLLTGNKFQIPDPPVAVSIVVPWLILVGYLTAGWGGTGRTFGKSMMGLRVVTRAGLRLPPRRAFLRALLCATFPWVILWVVISRKNLGLHDILFRTGVVYDWDVGV